MPKKSKTKGYTAVDMKAVSDNPVWKKEDFEEAVPFREAFPDLAKTIKGRGPQKAPTKVATSLRLSRVVVDHFKAQGPGWQARIDAELMKIARRCETLKKTASARKG